MERFCNDLKEHAAKIINYEKKEMIPLTDEENKSIKIQKGFIYAKKDLVLMMIKKDHKVKDHCHYTGKYSTCYLRHKTPKLIYVVFHNSSTVLH